VSENWRRRFLESMSKGSTEYGARSSAERRIRLCLAGWETLLREEDEWLAGEGNAEGETSQRWPNQERDAAAATAPPYGVLPLRMYYCRC
jgi:hypothetical protein